MDIRVYVRVSLGLYSHAVLAVKEGALELIEKVAQHPTLDTYLDRDKGGMTETERKDLIRALRTQRPFFLMKGKKAKQVEDEA